VVSGATVPGDTAVSTGSSVQILLNRTNARRTWCGVDPATAYLPSKRSYCAMKSPRNLTLPQNLWSGVTASRTARRVTAASTEINVQVGRRTSVTRTGWAEASATVYRPLKPRNCATLTTAAAAATALPAPNPNPNPNPNPKPKAEVKADHQAHRNRKANRAAHQNPQGRRNRKRRRIWI